MPTSRASAPVNLAPETPNRRAAVSPMRRTTKGEIADSCLQYWGGMGFMNETPVSRAYRDSRLGSIGGGSDEIMLTIICKLMGTLPGTSNIAERKRTDG